MADDLPDLRHRAAKAMAESVGSQAFQQPGPAWEGFRSGWLGYADAALSVVRPLLEQLRSRVAELEAHPVDWDAQRRRADIAEAETERLRAEAERHRVNYNAADAMAGVHKRCADRLRTELAHAKGALTGDSEAMTAFMADHAKVVERLREQASVGHRAADRADAALDRVFTLAQTLKAEAERGEAGSVIDSQRAAWRSSAHTAALFLAALDDPEGGRG